VTPSQTPPRLSGAMLPSVIPAYGTLTAVHRAPFQCSRNGARWTAVKVPYAGMTEGSIAPDRRGGVWLGVTVFGNGVERGYILHYRNGAWTRAAMPARDGEVTHPSGLASIPGTQSAWGVGQESPLAPMLDAYPGVIVKYGA